MFYECSSLKELDLSNFNINNVITMSYMFYNCSTLKELNLLNFNNNNVKYMSHMFYGYSYESMFVNLVSFPFKKSRL